jgi:hypothetical protein
MFNANKQLAAEVMTVIILGTATFLSVSSDQAPVMASGQSGLIATTVMVTPELPQDQVRDFTFGS